MIITIDISQVIISNCFLLDTKPNIIMEGNFTKLIYSTPHFTMNGLFISAPLIIHQNNTSSVITTEDATSGLRCLENERSKKSISFHPYLPENLKTIQELSRIEYRILEYYKQLYHRPQKISNVLSKQLYSGIMKLYKDASYTELNELRELKDNLNNDQKCIIKISGIWETHTDIGLTIKLLAIQDTLL